MPINEQAQLSIPHGEIKKWDHMRRIIINLFCSPEPVLFFVFTSIFRGVGAC